MKMIATIYSGRMIDWKIRVDSRPNKGVDDTQNRPLLDIWSPDNSQEKYLIYNPKIALVGKNHYDTRGNRPKDIYIPITLLYAFGNKLMLVYNYLEKPGLFTRDNGNLIMDQRLQLQGTQKLSIYRDSMVIVPSPVVGYSNQGGEDVKGVQFSVNNEYAGAMTHAEVREFCEILSHTDIQTYSLILATFEKLDNMDQKLDLIQGNQKLIIEYLQQLQDVEKVKVRGPATDFNWKPVS